MLQRIITVAVLAFASAFILSSISPTQSAMANNEKGKKLYMQYCASCHGIDGKGKGPVASSLCASLPDLTKIEKKDGKFPALRIQNVIAGEIGQTEITAHGTREMPVWGSVFREREDQGRSMLDVYALTKYIESIQQN
jgi:mono/diheme cytochrome c family protein